MAAEDLGIGPWQWETPADIPWWAIAVGAVVLMLLWPLLVVFVATRRPNRAMRAAALVFAGVGALLWLAGFGYLGVL